VTTTDAKAPTRGFFSIYKSGQGKYVRWGTVASIAIVGGGGLWWLAERTALAATENIALKVGILAGWALLTVFLAFFLVNKPSLADFMIMTESEMRKVTWPSRRELIVSTKVVILLTVILGLILWLVDVGFLKFFQLIRIS
jgi:preprotein translocase subunit SecE